MHILSVISLGISQQILNPCSRLASRQTWQQPPSSPVSVLHLLTQFSCPWPGSCLGQLRCKQTSHSLARPLHRPDSGQVRTGVWSSSTSHLCIPLFTPENISYLTTKNSALFNSVTIYCIFWEIFKTTKLKLLDSLLQEIVCNHRKGC